MDRSKSSRSPQDVVKSIEPEDGLAVEARHSESALALYLVYRKEGRYQPLPAAFLEGTGGSYVTQYVVVWDAHDPTVEDYGEWHRQYYLLDALCRYVNTGGSLDTLRGVFERLARMRPDMGDYKLLSTQWVEPGVAEHIFQRDGTHDCIRWVEGQFLEPTTLSGVRQDQEDEQRDQELHLQHPPDSGDAEEHP